MLFHKVKRTLLALLLTLCMVFPSCSSGIADPIGDSEIGTMDSGIPEDTTTLLIGAGMGQYTDMFYHHKSKHYEKIICFLCHLDSSFNSSKIAKEE